MSEDPQALEVGFLLEAIWQRYGYDFRNYSEASITRRLDHIRSKAGDQSLSQLLHRVLHQPGFFHDMVIDLTVTTSEMFRDPPFFRQLREVVCPILHTFPTINIWHAGCSTGEEVYSVAILLKEEGLLDRATIFATDINRHALKRAREGIYSAESLRTFTANYQKAGGKGSFAEYYHAAYGGAVMHQELRANVLFSEHNLVTDTVFAETHLVLCRNVMIYFQQPLQNRVLQIFSDSLRRGGFLCLGSKETLEFSAVKEQFQTVDPRARIYRKWPAGPPRK